MSDTTFERVGLGYVLKAESLSTELHVRNLKRSSGELSADVMVRCRFEGVKTVNGTLHTARFNLSATRTRDSLAKHLRSRTPGFETLDWGHLLEELCQRVLAAEFEGAPLVRVGQDPVEVSRGYVVDPTVPKGVVSLFYGPGGSGKSLIALAGAIGVTLGREMVPGLAPAVKGPVIYLDWETDRYVVNERIQYICKGADVRPPTLLYMRCNRPLIFDAERYTTIVRQEGVAMVIVDSAGMAMGASGEHGDANESTLRLFEAIRYMETTVQVIDHVSKAELSVGGKVRGKMPYGSIYKVNLARSAWEVRNSTEEGDEGITTTLFHVKSNDSALHSPIGLDIAWNADGIRFTSDAVAASYTRTMTLSERIAQELEMFPLSTEDLSANLDTHPAILRKTLMTDNHFKRTDDGLWAITR